MHFSHPLDALRYHVTGAVERGEAEPICALDAWRITASSGEYIRAGKTLGDVYDAFTRDSPDDFVHAIAIIL